MEQIRAYIQNRPINRPPALRPSITKRSFDPYPWASRYSAQAMKSVNVFFLVHHAAVIVATLPHLPTAANMATATTTPRSTMLNLLESKRCHRKTVRTVTGQIDWPFAVQLCAIQMDNRDRYLHTIGSHCENALDLISRAGRNRRNLILLQQLGNPFDMSYSTRPGLARCLAGL